MGVWDVGTEEKMVKKPKTVKAKHKIRKKTPHPNKPKKPSEKSGVRGLIHTHMHLQNQMCSRNHLQSLNGWKHALPSPPQVN